MYGAARLAARLGKRRAGPGPGPDPDWDCRARPLDPPDPDFLLFLMMSSRVISRAADMVVREALASSTRSKGVSGTRDWISEGRGVEALGFGAWER